MAVIFRYGIGSLQYRRMIFDKARRRYVVSVLRNYATRFLHFELVNWFRVRQTFSYKIPNSSRTDGRPVVGFVRRVVTVRLVRQFGVIKTVRRYVKSPAPPSTVAYLSAPIAVACVTETQIDRGAHPSRFGTIDKTTVIKNENFIAGYSATRAETIRIT